MATDLLTTSGINSLINSYKLTESNRILQPLNTRKSKYERLNTAWGDLNTRLNSLKSILSDLKDTTTESVFYTKKVESSNSAFVTASADKTAASSNYTMRVTQLAKSDIAVSTTMASSTAVTDREGTHSVRITSGDYYADFDVTLTNSETNKTIMEKIASAINADKAVVTSASVDGNTTFTGSGSFTIDLNGTEKTIEYDYSSGSTYSSVIDDLVSKINTNISGLTAEKVTDGSNVSLKITVNNSQQYITIDRTTDTGTLLSASNLDLNISNYKGAAGLVSASVFSPSSGNSKLSLTAKTTGYDNRLQMSDTSGSALSFLGLTSSILTSHTQVTGNDDAGFIHSVVSSTNNDLNAKIRFNGIDLQNNLNVIDDLVDGVSFNLKGVMSTEDADVSLTVQNDKDTVKAKITDFIKKFNDVYTYVKSKYNSDSSGRGIFVGDPTAAGLMNSFKQIAMSEVSGITTGNYSYLSQIGISFSPESGLSVTDDTKLSDALNDKPDQVAALFNSTNGIATTLYSKVETFTAVDGVISKLKSSYSNSLLYINDKIKSSQARIDKSAEILRDRYERLQTQLAQMLSTQTMFNSFGQSFF